MEPQETDFKEVKFLWNAFVSLVRHPGIPNLSQRQLAIYLMLYNTEERITVRKIEQDLKIGKPAISRALNSLTEYGLLRRRRDLDDRRSISVVRTTRGIEFYTMLGELLMLAKEGVQTPLPEHPKRFRSPR